MKPSVSKNAAQAAETQIRLIAAQCMVALLALCCLMLAHPVVDQDVWHEIALAREYFQHGSLPIHDIFAYTPTVDFIQHEWGAGVIALLFLEWFGGSGLVVLKYLLGAILGLFLFLRIRQDRPSLAILPPLVLLGMNMLQPGFGTVRAQIYSMCAVAILLWMLSLDRRGSNHRMLSGRNWMLPWSAVFVIWLNVHGGFVLAFGILGVEFLERVFTSREGWMVEVRRNWQLPALGVVMIALIALNPYGLRYYSYMVEALTIQRPDIIEWQPIWVVASRFPASVASLGIAAVVAAYAVLARGWRNTPGVGILVLLLAASIRTNRITMFFGVAFLAIVPGLLEGTPLANWANRTLYRFRGTAVPVTAVVAILLLAVVWLRPPFRHMVPGRMFPAYPGHVIYPVGAVEYLRQQQFRGNLMVPFTAGAYVSWKLYPEVKVSVDSRYEVAYPPNQVEQFIRVYRNGREANTVLAAYPHDAVLVFHLSPLRQALEAKPEWRKVYDDQVFRIYAKTGVGLTPELEAPLVEFGRIP